MAKWVASLDFLNSRGPLPLEHTDIQIYTALYSIVVASPDAPPPLVLVQDRVHRGALHEAPLLPNDAPLALPVPHPKSKTPTSPPTHTSKRLTAAHSFAAATRALASGELKRVQIGEVRVSELRTEE